MVCTELEAKGMARLSQCKICTVFFTSSFFWMAFPELAKVGSVRNAEVPDGSNSENHTKLRSADKFQDEKV
jgi:hypothetical protein